MDIKKIILNGYEKFKGDTMIHVLMQGHILSNVSEYFEGDIIEIGSHNGINATRFADIVKSFGKRVISLDPYNGEQQGSESVYEDFKDNTKSYDNIVQHRVSSFSESGVDVIKSTDYYYSCVDGLHTEQGAFDDLCNTVENTNFVIIYLDDTNESEVKKGMDKALAKYENLTVIKPIDWGSNHNPNHKKFNILIYDKDNKII